VFVLGRDAPPGRPHVGRVHSQGRISLHACGALANMSRVGLGYVASLGRASPTFPEMSPDTTLRNIQVLIRANTFKRKGGKGGKGGKGAQDRRGIALRTLNHSLCSLFASQIIYSGGLCAFALKYGDTGKFMQMA